MMHQEKDSNCRYCFWRWKGATSQGMQATEPEKDKETDSPLKPPLKKVAFLANTLTLAICDFWPVL